MTAFAENDAIKFSEKDLGAPRFPSINRRGINRTVILDARLRKTSLTDDSYEETILDGRR